MYRRGEAEMSDSVSHFAAWLNGFLQMFFAGMSAMIAFNEDMFMHQVMKGHIGIYHASHKYQTQDMLQQFLH